MEFYSITILCTFGNKFSEEQMECQLYVAILFVRNITDIDWNDIAESGPAVFAMIVMPLTYSISNGIALCL